MPGIRITGYENALSYGTLAALNCTTDLAIKMIQWFDINGRVIRNGTESFLELTDITTDSEASPLKYTCKVVGTFGNQSVTVTLQVLPEAVSSSPAVPSVAFAAISVVAALVVLVVAAVVVIIIVRYNFYILHCALRNCHCFLN